MSSVTPLDDGLSAIDLRFQGFPQAIASYLIQDAGQIALIDTGPTSTLPALLEGLTQAGVAPEEVSAVLLTHIHLDHAGAAGSFLRRFPRAHLYVHPAGAPHLIDPSRLLASAGRLYGDRMETLWGAVEPVPAERVTVLDDTEVVRVGGRQLRALHTPGHASHHVVFHDETRQEVFTGDLAGVRLPGTSYVRPPTMPPELDVEEWDRSMARVEALQPRTLYLAHYGPVSEPGPHLAQMRQRLYDWEERIGQALAAGQGRPQLVEMLRRTEDDALLAQGHEAQVLERLEAVTPYDLSVDGYLRHLRKKHGAL